MNWHAHFYGRTKGAIGIFYWITTTVDAPDAEAARLKLYDTHEHIQQLTLMDLADWSGSPCPLAPDQCWIDDATGEHIDATTGTRTPTHPTKETN